MLAPGQPAGLKREEAMRLIADCQQLRQRIERLLDGLRSLVEELSGAG